MRSEHSQHAVLAFLDSEQVCLAESGVERSIPAHIPPGVGTSHPGVFGLKRGRSAHEPTSAVTVAKERPLSQTERSACSKLRAMAARSKYRIAKRRPLSPSCRHRVGSSASRAMASAKALGF